MKWKNRDVIVAEQANISKFSKLDAPPPPPPRFFESFFVDMLVDMILATPSCAVIEGKQTLVLKISNELFRLFLGML